MVLCGSGKIGENISVAKAEHFNAGVFLHHACVALGRVEHNKCFKEKECIEQTPSADVMKLRGVRMSDFVYFFYKLYKFNFLLAWV